MQHAARARTTVRRNIRLSSCKDRRRRRNAPELLSALMTTTNLSNNKAL
jgi:hypothetical protein